LDAVIDIWKYIERKKRVIASTLNVVNDNSLDTYVRVTNALVITPDCKDYVLFTRDTHYKE